MAASLLAGKCAAGDLKMKKTYTKPALVRREVLSKVTAQEFLSGKQQDM
jgi:hypothetical protein